jgi:RimJ/RimL family protein N-acetyltransferase
MKPIEALSLGWRTELIFHRFDAQVVPRGDYLLVRTPHNPTYYWGNFLLFDRAPRAGDAAAWLAAFDAEIAQPQPASRHIAFGIDGEVPDALPADFEALGVRLFPATVLTMTRARLRAPRRPLAPGFAMRALRLPQEAPLAVEMQLASDSHGYEPKGYRIFRQRQMVRYGRMAEAGLGNWFGIFASTPGGDVLVADCGLFRDGPGPGALGRFQFVSTHPAWRRQGLCSALIHAVCGHGFEAMGLASLVIVADPHDVAIGLYEALGFARDHALWYIERPSRDELAPR